MICSRVQTILQRRRKQKRIVEISAPFDFKLEPVTLPGISDDDLAILRGQAAASRLTPSPSESTWSKISSATPTPSHLPVVVTTTTAQDAGSSTLAATR